MLNNVNIQGRLTNNPELKTSGSGVNFTNFSIACQRDFKNVSGEREIDFYDVTAWRGLAEYVARNFSKGQMCIISGRLQTRTWQDKDGKNHKSVDIVAENVYFCDSKREPQNNSGTTTQKQTMDGFAPIAEEDGELPF